MSHNVFKIPPQLRQQVILNWFLNKQAMKEMERQGMPAKKKKMRFKATHRQRYRYKNHNLRAEVEYSSQCAGSSYWMNFEAKWGVFLLGVKRARLTIQEKGWSETHIWQAKRMHMKLLWGHSIVSGHLYVLLQSRLLFSFSTGGRG